MEKWGVTLLLLGLILTGCSAKTDQKAEQDESKKTTVAVKVDEPKENEEESDIQVEITESENAFGEGMYKVGTDVPSGEYMLISNKGNLGYFSINSSSSSDSILQNDNFNSNSIITIEDGQYVTINRAKMYPMSDAPQLTPVNGALSDGMYIVGKHLQAGEYKIAPSLGKSGYFALYSGSSVSQLDDIIENDNFEGERYLTVKDGQYLKISRASINVNEKISVTNISTSEENSSTVEINSTTLEENKITVKQNQGGISYWKGNQEIITGKHWMDLSIEEKEQIIQLTRERIESSTDVPINRSNKEYVLLLDIFFTDETTQNEKIKVAIAGFIMGDIKKN